LYVPILYANNFSDWKNAFMVSKVFLIPLWEWRIWYVSLIP
jgi:hypothetical protein